MHGEKLLQHSPMKAVAASIRGGLEPGQVGGVLSRAGVGKAALVVHVALNSLLRGNPVLHVSLKDEQARVRSFYDEILGEVACAAQLDNYAAAAVGVERNRVIHASLKSDFVADDLERLLETFHEVMDFRPTMVVVHGLDSVDFAAEAWREVAGRHSLRLWLAVRTHREGGPTPSDLAASFDTAIALEPRGADVVLQVLRVGGQVAAETPSLRLDPVTMLVKGAPEPTATTAPPSPHPSACTLYSTGAKGAESVFGQQCARWGIKEVHFSFDGHEQSRTVGRRVLSERELRAGAVSLVYVNHRLGRTWSRADSMPKVLQLLWHVASSAQQIFVVGTIQEDGTVHGGTGWPVELARKWHKPVWVYDQDREGWFTWEQGSWTEGEPVIESPEFAGTGTRFLTEVGRNAIEDLFTRSFGD